MQNDTVLANRGERCVEDMDTLAVELVVPDDVPNLAVDERELVIVEEVERVGVAEGEKIAVKVAEGVTDWNVGVGEEDGQDVELAVADDVPGKSPAFLAVAE